MAEAAISSHLRVTVMRLARRLRAQRLDSGHSLTQFAALGSIERHGPISPGDLAEHERVRPPSMTRVVNHLEADGLIVRQPHPTDGRQQLLTITRAGKDLLVADRRRRDAWLAQQLASFTAEEIAALTGVLPLLERLAQA